MHTICENCQHLKVITSSTGSQFLMCLKSKIDARFAKYPPQPLTNCLGFERKDAQGDAR